MLFSAAIVISRAGTAGGLLGNVEYAVELETKVHKVFTITNHREGPYKGLLPVESYTMLNSFFSFYCQIHFYSFGPQPDGIKASHSNCYVSLVLPEEGE